MMNIIAIGVGPVFKRESVSPSTPSLTCDSTTVTADDTRSLTVNALPTTLREQFELMNTHFTTLYTQ